MLILPLFVLLLHAGHFMFALLRLRVHKYKSLLWLTIQRFCFYEYKCAVWSLQSLDRVVGRHIYLEPHFSGWLSFHFGEWRCCRLFGHLPRRGYYYFWFCALSSVSFRLTLFARDDLWSVLNVVSGDGLSFWTFFLHLHCFLLACSISKFPCQWQCSLHNLLLLLFLLFFACIG